MKFRLLTDEEEKAFRLWARENFDANKSPAPYWHPVVREEWDKCLQEAAEVAAQNAPVETPLGEEIDGGAEVEYGGEYDGIFAQYDDDPNPYEGTYSED